MMSLIENMAKARAYDEMQNKSVTDAMNAAQLALAEQRDKEANMNKLFQNMVGGMQAQQGLAGTVQQPAATPAPRTPVVPAPVQGQGLANSLNRQQG